MDAFIKLFLFIAAVIFFIAAFRYIKTKDKKREVSKNHYDHASHLFDYQNDPTDHRNLLNPGNPVGPNWVGAKNLFRDRHNHTTPPTINESERKQA